MREGDFSLVGYQGSKIEWNKVQASWILEDPSNPEQYAIAKGVHPLLGTRVFFLSEKLGGQNITLNINACNDDTEYGCDDGECIAIGHRCDSKYDCIDQSDESNCHIINVPTSYISHVPAGRRFL